MVKVKWFPPYLVMRHKFKLKEIIHVAWERKSVDWDFRNRCPELIV